MSRSSHRPDLAPLLDVTLRKGDAIRIYRIARSHAREHRYYASSRFVHVTSLEDVAALLEEAQREIAQLRAEGWTAHGPDLVVTITDDGGVREVTRDLEDES